MLGCCNGCCDVEVCVILELLEVKIREWIVWWAEGATGGVVDHDRGWCTPVLVDGGEDGRDARWIAEVGGDIEDGGVGGRYTGLTGAGDGSDEEGMGSEEGNSGSPGIGAGA